MVIIGQDIAGYSIVDALDLPAPADAFRAVDAEGREVTLYVKTLDVSAEVFTAEVERLLSLSSAMRSAIPALDGGVAGDAGWIAAPAADEVPIEGLLPRFQPIARELVAEVADQIREAHGVGLVHGDLGPHTVVVTAGGVTALRAFGFSRAFGAPDDPEADAARYRAPEIFNGGPIDRRTDVYGLGMLLYALLAGRPPFGEHDDLGACALRETPEPLPLTSAPAWLNAALAQAFAKDPDARFQTVDDLMAAMRMPSADPLLPLPPATGSPPSRSPASDTSPVPDTEPSGPIPPSRDTLPTGTLPPDADRRPMVQIVDRSRRRRFAGVAALVLVAGGVGLMAALLPGRSPPSTSGGAQTCGGAQVSCAPPGARTPADPPSRQPAHEDHGSRVAPPSAETPLHDPSKPIVPVATTGENLRDGEWYTERY